MDMYDFPNEIELAKAIVESKSAPKKVNEIETKTIFPFWSPIRNGKNPNVVSDKSGAVKAKDDLRSSDIEGLWDKFLTKLKTDGKKPVTNNDNFGSVVVKTYAQKPNAKNLVGSIKALKKTNVKELSGKSTTKTEELGVAKVITKSNAQHPSKNNLVGIVKPVSKANLAHGGITKENLLKTLKKPVINDTRLMETKVLKSYTDQLTKLSTPNTWSEAKSMPKASKPTGKTVVCDKTGIVKPKKMEK